MSLSDEIFQKMGREAWINSLNSVDANIESSRKIADYFSFDTTYKGLIKQFPDMGELIENVEKIVPGFSRQVEKSQDLLLSLFRFQRSPDEIIEAIEESPFLGDAILENPNMGSKLLVQFPKFDKLSQENISILFNTKKEILEKNPAIDPDSPEFRQLMQEKLKGYKNNPRVCKAAEAKGINMDQWLNYSKEEEFTLGAEKPVPFTEMVKMPIVRMQKTVEAYQKQLMEAFAPFLKELSEFQIPSEDVAKLEGQQVHMREQIQRARAEGNEKRAERIEKSLESHRKKSEITESLWEKIKRDHEAIAKVQKELFKVNEEMVDLEQEELKIGTNIAFTAKERRKALQEAKAKRKQSEHVFKETLD